MTKISASLNVNKKKQITCDNCDYEFCSSKDFWKDFAYVNEVPLAGVGGKPYTNGSSALLRTFYCPSCATLLDSETALAGDPYLNDIVKV